MTAGSPRLIQLDAGGGMASWHISAIRLHVAGFFARVYRTTNRHALLEAM